MSSAYFNDNAQWTSVFEHMVKHSCACNWSEFPADIDPIMAAKAIRKPRFAIYLCTAQSFEIYMLIIQSSAGIISYDTFPRKI